MRVVSVSTVLLLVSLLSAVALASDGSDQQGRAKNGQRAVEELLRELAEGDDADDDNDDDDVDVSDGEALYHASKESYGRDQEKFGDDEDDGDQWRTRESGNTEYLDDDHDEDDGDSDDDYKRLGEFRKRLKALPFIIHRFAPPVAVTLPRISLEKFIFHQPTDFPKPLPLIATPAPPTNPPSSQAAVGTVQTTQNQLTQNPTTNQAITSPQEEIIVQTEPRILPRVQTMEEATPAPTRPQQSSPARVPASVPATRGVSWPNASNVLFSPWMHTWMCEQPVYNTGQCLRQCLGLAQSQSHRL
ncbi:uncharacterized protein LOC135819062 [Sycon ciliatum]|uniref:uncharacterized protein LOC135819062 n=1 Tax=Sycon ciliatum TaxID=27933 RepID=UPI0031F721AA